MLNGGQSPSSTRLGGDLALWALLFAVGVIPVALVLAQPHNLYGITEYDDGVYFAAALRLVSGVLPYKDFVFVEPPGISVVLAPFALLTHLVSGRSALGAARIFTAGVAGANAVLVAVLLRYRGRLAMAVSGLALGIFPTAYAADHTFLQEPFCVLFCLIGANLVFSKGAVASPRRCAFGGAAIAFACDIKTLALVALVAAFVVVLRVAPRRAAAFALGVAVAVVVTVLPFFVAAPHAFIHEVIGSQLMRGTTRPTPLVNRLFAVMGLAYAAPSLSVHNEPGVPAAAMPTVIAAVAMALVIVTLFLRLLARRDRSPLSWFVILGALLSVVTALGPPAYYAHYAYLPAPFLALALGLGAALLPGGLRRLLAKRAPASRRPVEAVLVGLAALVLGVASIAVLVVSGRFHESIADKFGDDGPTIAALVPAGSCVVSDSESVLVSAGRASPQPGCPDIIDATGSWLSADPAHPPVRLHPPIAAQLGGKDPTLVALWAHAFSHVQYVVASGCTAFRIPWTTSLLTQFEEQFQQLPDTNALVYVRRAAPLSHLGSVLPSATSKCLLP